MVKKKIFAILFVFVLCLSMMIPAFAAKADGFTSKYSRVIDQADLLTDSEEESLLKKLDELSLRQNMDVVVVTTNSLSGYSVRSYADALYENCGFGYGSSKDGLMLLISTEDNDWYISTCGLAITAFTDAGIEYIGEQITSDLSDGDYAQAFDEYVSLCDDFITQAQTGEPYDSDNLPQKSLSLLWILLSLIIGFVLAKIIVVGMKGELKTVRFQAAANSYLKKGSLNITESRDMFLYNVVTKSEKPKSSNSSGSSTHSSSSGTTHGGGGGKF